MIGAARIEEELRRRILSAPEVILEDRDVMRALVGANERAMGGNIVDLRRIAMDRLEARLDRLEDTHRSVIAAAYENLSGTNSIHRAVLRLLDADSFEDFLDRLAGEAAETLRVDSVRLVLESRHEPDAALDRLAGVLCVAEPGFVDAYLSDPRGGPPRQVTLRQIRPGAGGLYGAEDAAIASEALIGLDLGPGRLPGMLALGSCDPAQFRSGQGTDLLAFFGGVFERAMRRWLG